MSSVTIWGVPAQVDFGNLMVGIATAGVAIVTLMISLWNVDQLRKQKIADLRNAWLDDLRVHLSSLAAEIFAISVGHDVKDKERQLRIFHHVFYIRLKLASSSKAEKLTELMGRMQDAALKNENDQFDKLEVEYMELSRLIILNAWDDIRSDLK